MSEVLSTVGQVAGLVAAVATPLGLGATVAKVAAGLALGASIGSQLTAKRPPIFGSSTDITIGADQPRPWMMGDTYNGGSRQLQTAYGSPINDVPNPLAAIVDVYSMGGPIEAITGYYLDFNPVTFSGAVTPGNPPREATGYFDDILFVQAHWGASPQAIALSGAFGTAVPGWGASAKISGGTHALWSLKWDSKNGKFTAGVPQLGIRGLGALTYDPRLDSTYPGGSGAHRWAPPSDRAAHDAALATHSYQPNPALYGLRYALGIWERDRTDAESDYQLTFGIGLPWDAVIVEDFVDWANVCDLNGWEISGVIYEPGDRWANLKRICEAGGAEPVWKGGRLGVKVNAPRVALDTIDLDDIAEGEVSVPSNQRWQARFNTALPKCKSPAHKWELQQSAPYAVADYIAQDGEQRQREVPFELVKDFDQAAQLAAYSMFNSREQGPITVPILPRLRGYFGGDRLSFSAAAAARYGMRVPEVVVLQRSFDPGSMTGTLTLATETMAKHALALAATGTEPEPITLPGTGDFDGAISSDPNSLQYQVANSWTTGLTITAADAGSDCTITISAHTRNYLDGTTASVEGGTITGLAFEQTVFVAYDDAGRSGGAVTYVAHADTADAGPTNSHPGRHFVKQITTPADGGGTVEGGDGPPPWKLA